MTELKGCTSHRLIILLCALALVLINLLHFRGTFEEISDRFALQDDFFDPEDNRFVLEDDGRPRNLRVAFIGDSLTRFQYVSLVYFLKYDHWSDDQENPGLLNYRYYGTWSEWMSNTSSIMQPEEHCDCYRMNKPNASSLGNWHARMNENRYYSDERGNYVTYFLKFGLSPVNGHWDAKEVYVKQSLSLQDDSVPYQYQYNWTQIIRDYVSEMDPKPDYLVFNAAAHPHDLGDKTVQQSIVQALNEAGITGIYKTTTYPKIKGKFQGAHDDELCRAVGHCINLNWTRSVPRKYYLDSLHFNSKVNTVMNKQFLQYIDTFDPASGDMYSPSLNNVSALLATL